MRTSATVLVAALVLLGCATPPTDTDSSDATATFRSSYVPVTREYWITTEVIPLWDMVPTGKAHMTNQPVDSARRFLAGMIRYIQTDANWNPLPRPEWLGLTGPTIYATVGDSVIVHFKNSAETGMPLSIHPHNLLYDINNEGAWRADMPEHWPELGTAGGSVQPGDTFTYHWFAADVSVGVGPYHSHSFRPTEEMDKGLIGLIVVDLPPDHPDFVRADTTVTFVFKTYLAAMRANDSSGETVICAEPLIPWNGGCHPRDHVPPELWPENRTDTGLVNGGPEVHAINGIAFANLAEIVVNKGDRVRFVAVAMNDEGDQNHTIHFHGAMLFERSRPEVYGDVFDLPSALARELILDADNPGNWMIHCHVEHHTAEMMATYMVQGDSLGTE